jgi:GNAT superfamily N-acetyltransferase
MFNLQLEETLQDPELDIISDGMRRHAEEFTEIVEHEKVTATIRDDGGTLVGAALGKTGRGWLFVVLLWVHESHRSQGYGSRLLEAIESEARARGCHSAYLDTFSYQARPFYERHGYEVFGVLDRFSGAHRKYFMKKSLDTPARPSNP